MEFISFLRALSLEPVDDSVITKMIGSVKFQGNLIDTTELGPEMTEALTRLLNDDHMDYDDSEGVGRRNGDEVTLFGNIKLPEISAKYYLTRRLEHNVVLLTKSGSGWKALGRELIQRMQKEEIETVGEQGDFGRREIFAISWVASSNGGGGGEDRVGEYSQHNGKVGDENEESECDNELLKVSELLKWATKKNESHFLRGYDDEMEVDEDDEEVMEVDKDNNTAKNQREKYLKIFVDPWVNPPGNAKLRLIELDEIENPDVQFNSLCSEARLFTIHWLQAFSNGGFIWKKTRGPLKISRLKLNTISYQEEKWFPYLEHKAWQNVICVSGVAGMGKTTFLANMAHELKRKCKNRLICFIDLKRLSDLIDTMNVKSLDILKFPELLLKYFDIESDLEQSIFKCLMSTLEGNIMEPKVELLMDGLDRMTSKARYLLVNFLKDELSLCDKWSYRVWLATRPHLKCEVEDAFSIVAYDLDMLNSTDTVQYFKMCHDNFNADFVPELHSVATALFTASLRAHLKIDLGTLLGTPERMVAFETFMKQNDYPNPFKLNSYRIMSEIIMKNVKRCYVKNYLEENPNNNNDSNGGIADKILSKHIPFAILVCSGKNGGPMKGLNLTEELSSAEEADLLNFGIMTKDRDDKFYFIHSAYPTYILADHYRNSVPDHGFRSDFFLNYVLIKDACDLIRQFYDESLTTGVNYDISSEWMDLLRNFLIKTYLLSNESFDHNCVQDTTSLLHLAIIDQRLNLAKLILRSFAPEHHRVECQRLIRRKVKVQISDLRQYVKNKKTRCNNMKSSKKLNGKLGSTKRGKNGKNFPLQHHIELSALSLAVMLGDMELVHSMYLILGNESDNAHMERFTKNDSFHFSPLHLAVIGCNPQTFKYLTHIRKVSPNRLAKYGCLPIHLLFFNRWILRFPSTGLGSLEFDSGALREVHICKYYEDTLDPEWVRRVGEVVDRAGHLPLLSSRFVTEYTKMKMKESLNFAFKPRNQTWKICYYKSYQAYLSMAKSLSGRTFINFRSTIPEETKAKIPPPFHLACAAGYLPMIEAMMEKGVNMNIRDKNNRTAVYAALCKEQMHVVQYLVEKGIECDFSQMINGIPLVHHLSLQNFKEAIRYLVQQFNVPVDLHAKEADNCTPLHMACIGGSLEAAEVLIAFGANVNSKDEEQYTPLFHATHPNASCCNLDLVKLLIKEGADVNAVCESAGGRTCLHEAVTAKNLPLVKCLLEYAKEDIDIDAVTYEEGQSALHLACKQTDNLEVVKVLVGAGATVDLLDAKGQTPLFVFSLENHSDRAMGLHLIKEGASLYQINDSGQCLLRELNKRNQELGELYYRMWRSMRENDKKVNRDNKLSFKNMHVPSA